jgi:alkanesulfonate monooxygenase SsuD/methylene tetrahydromethanopterin reductase-like flavin-dependent oxidoreductase (luciferase family)
MTDYGHDLLFGSFITPGNAAPDNVVALAQLSEAAGLDLVTFQDHPYQSAFLDTWTLMSFVAARTERVHIAGNVLNLPLRQPAVLARAAASLDLLSGGRVELGLGAGGFWDPIVAMGGERLSPGESLTALREAIDVIRGIWDKGNPERLVVDGMHHRVNGAKRGPVPAHDVAIWVGGLKPRMLRLIGEKADGWLPSLAYLKGMDQIDESNSRIDEAASAAGRDPKDVRRLVNIGGQFTAQPSERLLVGPPSQWTEQLATLALEHGLSGFVVVGDDPNQLALFGQEVAPATRELVAAERTRRGTPAAHAGAAN